MSILKNIKGASDLKALTLEQLPVLCKEIREVFIESLMRTGGHFSGNLGVVELTVALHYVFDLDSDKLVWDVGHQAYIHKMLTGRLHDLDSIRKWGGISGFPKISESKYDHFGTGHSSTSISAVLGMAEAVHSKHPNRRHVAVIGDGSLSGGMAFEGLNNLGHSKANVLVVVNDNQIGIDPHDTAINAHLGLLDELQSNLFTDLNLSYTGPVDGHDVIGLVHVLKDLSDGTGPRVLHIKTLKGKGHEAAELEQTMYHSVKYVKIRQGNGNDDQKRKKFQTVFGETLLALARANADVVGVTPAMPSGSSMNILQTEMPDRVYDVGIAEQHAVTFAAGMALEGKRVFCHLYSSFAQRAYDQIIHDVALQNIPVIFCLDRAGLVGEDGPTHHGVFDVAALSVIPNLKIVSPRNLIQLRDAMCWAVGHTDGPVCIRYPRGTGSDKGMEDPVNLDGFEQSKVLSEGDELAVISLGSIAEEVERAITKANLVGKVQHIDVHMVKPLDRRAILSTLEKFNKILVVEENLYHGGIGQQVRAIAQEEGINTRIECIAIFDEFSPHGNMRELRSYYGMDSANLSKRLIGLLND